MIERSTWLCGARSRALTASCAEPPSKAGTRPWCLATGSWRDRFVNQMTTTTSKAASVGGLFAVGGRSKMTDARPDRRESYDNISFRIGIADVRHDVNPSVTITLLSPITDYPRLRQ